MMELFCESKPLTIFSKKLHRRKAVDFFCKKNLHHRHLTGFYVFLCYTLNFNFLYIDKIHSVLFGTLIGLWIPSGNCMFKVNNRNTRTRYGIYAKSTKKTLERCHWRRSDLSIVNFEYISYLILVFLLLTSSR